MTRYADGAVKAAAVLGLNSETLSHISDAAGLAALSAYPAYHLYKAMQSDEPVGEHLTELAGLGLLAAPVAYKLLKK